MFRTALVLSVLALSACTTEPDSAEVADFDAAAWTADEEAGVVAFLADDDVSTLHVLDDICLIRSDSAKHIVKYRDGKGYGDGSIDSLEELDSINMVGPWTIDQIVRCAEKYGYFEYDEPDTCEIPGIVDHWIDGGSSEWRAELPADLVVYIDSKVGDNDACEDGISSFGTTFFDHVVIRTEACELTGYYLEFGQTIDLGIQERFTVQFDADLNEVDAYCRI